MITEINKGNFSLKHYGFFLNHVIHRKAALCSFHIVWSCAATTNRACLPFFWTNRLGSASVAVSWLSHSSQYIFELGMVRFTKEKPLLSLTQTTGSFWSKGSCWSATSFDVVEEESPDGAQTHPWPLISELQRSVWQSRMWGLKHCGSSRWPGPAVLVGSYWPTTCVCVCVVKPSTCAFWRKSRLCAEQRQAFASLRDMPSLHLSRQLGQRWPWPWVWRHKCPQIHTLCPPLSHTHTRTAVESFLHASYAAVNVDTCLQLSLQPSHLAPPLAIICSTSVINSKSLSLQWLLVIDKNMGSLYIGFWSKKSNLSELRGFISCQFCPHHLPVMQRWR